MLRDREPSPFDTKIVHPQDQNCRRAFMQAAFHSLIVMLRDRQSSSSDTSSSLTSMNSSPTIITRSSCNSASVLDVVQHHGKDELLNGVGVLIKSVHGHLGLLFASQQVGVITTLSQVEVSLVMAFFTVSASDCEICARARKTKALSTVSADLYPAPSPVSLSIGTSKDSEAVVHSVWRWMLRHSDDTDRCLLSMDLHNAFNRIDHPCFFREIRRVAPGLTRFCDLWYDSFVLFELERISSQRGIQQGDPWSLCSSLLASMGTTCEGRLPSTSTTTSSAVHTLPPRPFSQASRVAWTTQDSS